MELEQYVEAQNQVAEVLMFQIYWHNCQGIYLLFIYLFWIILK